MERDGNKCHPDKTYLVLSKIGPDLQVFIYTWIVFVLILLKYINACIRLEKKQVVQKSP